MIKHFPITNINKVIEHYSQKDNVPISYVCTTDYNTSDRPVDIFYRNTPHPKFGNRYFAIAVNYNDESYSIFGADAVETFTFGMVEDDEANLQYSQYRHDYKSFDNGNMIDGGRSYTRYSGKIKYYRVKDGQMVKDVS